MHPGLREICLTLPTIQSTLDKVAEILPADDAELDAWLTDAVENHDAVPLLLVVGAALHTGRKVSSRHIANGAKLLYNPAWVGNFVTHASGDDVHLQVARALKVSGLPPMTAAIMILATWYWCEERGIPFPDEITAHARMLARATTGDMDAQAIYIHFCCLNGDKPLQEYLLIEECTEAEIAEFTALSGLIATHYMKSCKLPFRDLLPKVPQLGGHSGTVRRSVAETGRNEPCPCGSGKKYKRCCADKDRQRLAQSSDIAGKTTTELMTHPTESITAQRLPLLNNAELMKIDAAALPPELRLPFLRRLIDVKLLDEGTDAFERMEWDDAFTHIWELYLQSATNDDREKIIHRLIAVRGFKAEVGEMRLRPGVRFYLARNDPKAALDLFEEISRALLVEEDRDAFNGTLMDILLAPTGATGILLIRGIFPLLSTSMMKLCLGLIARSRAKIGLPPHEPFVELMEKRLSEEAAATSHKNDKSDAKLAETLKQLHAKAAEEKKLRTTIAGLEADLKKRELKTVERAAAPQTKNTPATAQDLADTKALREKIALFKAEVTERNRERTDLRNIISTLIEENKTLRDEIAKAEQTPKPAEEDTLPFDIAAIQPVRLIAFPEKFSKDLAALPANISRSAMEALGRLAGGEESAFGGVKRIKCSHEILSTRIGADHRLLFRLGTEAVEVVALINRRDLDKTLKTVS